MPSEVTFTVNGKPRKVNTPGDRPLLEVLREDLHLTGTKYGCGEGQCRACTVLIDGKAVISCRLPVAEVAGKSITTIEGLADANGKLHAVQQAFVEAGAMQCGYCVPGMVLTTAALLASNPKPSEREMIVALNGNLCRCCGYPNIVSAVRLAASRGAERKGSSGGASTDQKLAVSAKPEPVRFARVNQRSGKETSNAGA